MQYRKKLVIVEATQWFPGTPHPAVRGDGPDKNCNCAIVCGADLPHVHTPNTLEAVYLTPGCWIITWSNGKHAVYSNQDFYTTFEPLEAGDNPDGQTRASANNREPA